MDAIRAIEAEQLKADTGDFRIGDTVRVHFKIVEGKTERVQVFEGIVIARKRTGLNETFTVRKISYGVGVERVFPLHSPKIVKVVRVREGRVRRVQALLPARQDGQGREGHAAHPPQAQRGRPRGGDRRDGRRRGRAGRAGREVAEAGAAPPGSAPEPMPSVVGPVPPAQPGSIQVSARSGLGLRAGDVVTLHVIKRLTDDKWAVGLKGRVLPARSDLDLSPGATLRARVQSAAGRVVFVLERGTPSALADALLRAGCRRHPRCAAHRRGPRGRRQAGGPGTVERVRALLAKTRLEARRGARAAATMLDKGIELSSSGAADLLELLCLAEPGGRDPRRHSGRRFPRDAGEAKADLAATAAPDGPTSGLHVYNALRGTQRDLGRGAVRLPRRRRRVPRKP